MSDKITFEQTLAWFQSTDYQGALGLTVKFVLPPENTQAFIDFYTDYKPYVLEEEGCIQFGFERDWQDANTFWLVERWVSPQILLAHLGDDARKGTKYEGATPLNIMAELRAQPEPAALYLID